MRNETKSVIFFIALIFLLSPSVSSLTSTSTSTSNSNSKLNKTHIENHQTHNLHNLNKTHIENHQAEKIKQRINNMRSKNALKKKNISTHNTTTPIQTNTNTTNLVQQNGSLKLKAPKDTTSSLKAPKDTKDIKDTISSQHPTLKTPVEQTAPAIVASARNINCNSSNCLPPHGTCTNKNTCTCFSGYANFTPAGQPKSNKYCNYERKNQLTAFLLELFFPFGVGHLYLGEIVLGLIKMGVILIIPVTFIILLFCGGLKSDASEGSGCCYLILIGLLYLDMITGCIWQVVDLILLVLNNYNDSNGIKPKPW